MLHLDDDTAKHSILSIRLAPDGFSFFLLNEKNNNVLFFKNHPIPFHQDTVAKALKELRKDELFSFPFKEVMVLFDFPDVTIIPSALYDEEQKEKAFVYNNDLAPREYVIDNHCAAYGVEVLFAIPKALYDFFSKQFSHFRIIHKITLLLNQANEEKTKAQEQLYISFSEEHFTALGFRNNCLIFHNVFTLNMEEDLIYYLLLVFQELDFDQYNARVLIDGTIKKDHPFISVIQEYIKHIDFAVLNNNFKYPESMSSQPEHFYSALSDLPLCAL